MSSTPTKHATNSPSGWRRISDKINILKTSTRGNDTPTDEVFPNSYEFSPEVDAILDFRISNGLEQYCVAWKCSNGSDLKTTWEQEPVLELMCKEALVKFWVKTLLTPTPHPENDSERAVLMKKLRNWCLLPSSSSCHISPKKEPVVPLLPICQTRKRPRLDIDSPDIKPKVSDFSTVRGNLLKIMDEFPGHFRIILEPEEFAELIEKPSHEFGEFIPMSCEAPLGEFKEPLENGKRNPYLVAWHYISLETPESLGISDENCRLYFDQKESARLLRNRYDGLTTVKKLTKENVESALNKNDDSKSRSSDSESSYTTANCAASDTESDLSTRPPSSSSASLSSNCDSESSTCPPSLSSPDLNAVEMEYECPREETVEKVETEAQTDELDPFTCAYCHAKKGELLRLSSLRHKIEIKKEVEDEVVNKNTQDTKPNGNTKKESEEDEDDDDMVHIEYEIEQILDYRKQEGTNLDEYYIRWKNYTKDYDTWEPDSNLSCCDKALINFYVKRACERRNADYALMKQAASTGANTANGTNAIVSAVSSNSKKKIKLPALPPVPEVILDILNGVIPISDGEVEMAYKLIKTVKKKSIWTKKKLLKVMLGLISESRSGSIPPEKAAAQAELPDLRHQILMIEAERRKDVSLRDLKEWERQLNLIAKGKPEIVVENTYDLAGPPEDFRYINDNVLGEGVNFPDDPLEGCNCEDSCGKDKTSCCPGKHEKVLAYNNFKRLRVLPGYPIYECNKKCKCGPECLNRVVQDGTVNLVGTKLCIFRTNNDRGWGVKTLKKIKRGTFVCLYAGEIITSEEAEKRGQVYEKELGACYLFDLDYYAGDNLDDTPYTIDATKMGNVAHFINHSCEPNLCVFNVWADCVDQNLPKLAFFALRDISRDEELTYDYGSHDDLDATAPSLAPFAPRDDEPKNPIIKEMDEETDSDSLTENGTLFLNSSPVKNRMKPTIVSMSAVRRPCLCGAKICRKVLF